jgi:hypothetical protein
VAELTDLKLGKPVAVHFSGESQAPFVTGVIPVVGQNDDPFGQAPLRRLEWRSARGPQIASRPLDERFVALTPITLQEKEEGNKGQDEQADNAAFGLGNIRFTAHVSVEYELAE